MADRRGANRVLAGIPKGEATSKTLEKMGGKY
jgi:hypothetical protein